MNVVDNITGIFNVYHSKLNVQQQQHLDKFIISAAAVGAMGFCGITVLGILTMPSGNDDSQLIEEEK